MRLNKIKKDLYKLFKKHSIKCEIYTINKNEFGEIEDDVLLCNINGLFYEETTRVNLNVNMNGTSTTTAYKTLMVLKDNNSDMIKKSMYCIIKGVKYEIVEVVNYGMLDIYYNLRLKECNNES